MACIYGLFDPRNPIVLWEVRYIGQTKDTPEGRLRDALSAAPRNLNRPVNVWMLELRDLELKPIVRVLESLASDDRDHMDVREKAWVKSGRTQGWDLLNANGGGRGNPGFSPSQETRDKLSRANRGQTRTPEQRARMSAGARGIPKSEEHKAKISETMKCRPLSDGLLAANESRRGVPLSEERRKKQSESIKSSPKARVYWDTLVGRTLPEEQRIAISIANTGNPKIIEASIQGGNEFKRKFESDPEFAAAWKESNQAATAIGREKMFKRRLQCGECGFISNPQGIGHHQTSFGHSGKTELEPVED